MCVILGNIAAAHIEYLLEGGVWVTYQTHPLVHKHVKSTYLFRKMVLLVLGRKARPAGSASAALAASPRRF